jgi:hypothetical protein
LVYAVLQWPPSDAVVELPIIEHSRHPDEGVEPFPWHTPIASQVPCPVPVVTAVVGPTVVVATFVVATFDVAGPVVPAPPKPVPTLFVVPGPTPFVVAGPTPFVVVPELKPDPVVCPGPVADVFVDPGPAVVLNVPPEPPLPTMATE